MVIGGRTCGGASVGTTSERDRIVAFNYDGSGKLGHLTALKSQLTAAYM
jgi:YD repeat-containing protein